MATHVVHYSNHLVDSSATLRAWRLGNAPCTQNTLRQSYVYVSAFYLGCLFPVRSFSHPTLWFYRPVVSSMWFHRSFSHPTTCGFIYVCGFIARSRIPLCAFIDLWFHRSVVSPLCGFIALWCHF
jgi:hypothetical protein